jgi:hypothetical protein
MLLGSQRSTPRSTDGCTYTANRHITQPTESDKMTKQLKSSKKMNSEVKKLWIAALLSGDYNQGTGQLRDVDNNFCCLGVLCNIHAQLHPEFAAKQMYQTQYGHQGSLLPIIVEHWAGVDKYSNGSHPHTLASMNDGEMGHHQHSFKEIAKYIQKNL